MERLRNEDQQGYANFCRITPELFDEICERIQARIEKESTNFVQAHPAGLKLAITLRFLATGDSSKSLYYGFCVPRSTISTFLPEVCDAIIAEYKDEVINFPNTPEGWRQVAERFATKWNVPHALGAIGGKHIRIRKPNRSGSLYYNYKKFYSLVLLAVVDADYKFMYADIGGMGHQSDCQLYNDSSLAYGLENGHLNLPPPEPLPNDNVPFPYFFLGDDAFALREHMMKPYSERHLTMEQRIYNYRISRGRMVVENAFGILAQRWHCFLHLLMHEPVNIQKFVHAAVCLHNLIRIRQAEQGIQDIAPGVSVDREDAQHNIIPGEWRETANLIPLDPRRQGHRELDEAKRCRRTLEAYFNSPAGSVPWQTERVKQRLGQE